MSGKDEFKPLLKAFKKHLKHDRYEAINDLVGSRKWQELKDSEEKLNQAYEVENKAIKYYIRLLNKYMKDLKDKRSFERSFAILGTNIWICIEHADKHELEYNLVAAVEKELEKQKNSGKSVQAYLYYKDAIERIGNNQDIEISTSLKKSLEQFQLYRQKRDHFIETQRDRIKELIKQGYFDKAEAVLNHVKEKYGDNLDSIINLSSELNLLQLKIEEQKKKFLQEGQLLQQQVKQFSEKDSHKTVTELEELLKLITKFLADNPDESKAKGLKQTFDHEAKKFLANKAYEVNELMGPEEAVEWFSQNVLESHFASYFENITDYTTLQAIFRNCFESSWKRIHTEAAAMHLDEAVAELSRFDHRTCTLHSKHESGNRATWRKNITDYQAVNRDIQTETGLLERLRMSVSPEENSPLMQALKDRSDELGRMQDIINRPIHTLDPSGLAATIAELEHITQIDGGQIGHDARNKIPLLQKSRLEKEAAEARKERDLRLEQQCLQELLRFVPNDNIAARRLDEVTREYEQQQDALKQGKQALKEHMLNRAIISLKSISDKHLSEDAAPLLEEAEQDKARFNEEAQKILPELDRSTRYPLADIPDRKLDEMRVKLRPLSQSFEDSATISERFDAVKMEKSIREIIADTVQKEHEKYRDNISGLLEQDTILEAFENYATHPRMAEVINLVAADLEQEYIDKVNNMELHTARRLYGELNHLPAEAFEREYLSFSKDDSRNISKLDRNLDDAEQQASFALIELEKLRMPEADVCIRNALALCNDLPKLKSARKMQADIVSGREIMLAVDTHFDDLEKLGQYSQPELDGIIKDLDRAEKLLPSSGALTVLGLKYSSISEYREIINDLTGIKGRMLLNAYSDQKAYWVFVGEEGFFEFKKHSNGDRNSIPLTHASVKKKHAKIMFNGDTPVIEALSGDVTANGDKVTRHTLSKGDELKIGFVKCKVAAADKDALIIEPHVPAQLDSLLKLRGIAMINRQLKFRADGSGHLKHQQLQQPFELVRDDKKLQLRSKDKDCEIRPGADIKLKETNISFEFKSAL